MLLFIGLYSWEPSERRMEKNGKLLAVRWKPWRLWKACWERALEATLWEDYFLRPRVISCTWAMHSISSEPRIWYPNTIHTSCSLFLTCFYQELRYCFFKTDWLSGLVTALAHLLPPNTDPWPSFVFLSHIFSHCCCADDVFYWIMHVISPGQSLMGIFLAMLPCFVGIVTNIKNL